MSWKDVQTLRKAGDVPGAKGLAYELLASDPKDFRTRSQLEWAIYDGIKPTLKKAQTAIKEDKRPLQGDIRHINDALVEFTKIPPEKPGMACSVLLGQLCRIAPEFPRFAAFVEWVGTDGLREEDWQPHQFEDGQFPALAVLVARALAKWSKARADTTPERLEQVLAWVAASRPSASGDDQLWLEWDSAGVLRRLGRHAEAATVLSSVIKAKRNEFWVWAEAGRLHVHDDPDLALACFCRALECPSDPEFVVKVRRELAELLAERGEYAQASVEITSAAAARTAQGWSLGKELQALMGESWYEPEGKGAEDPKRYYAHHSGEALTLCFDHVETRPANYLGLFVPPKNPSMPDRKPRPKPRFAIIKSEGESLSILGPHSRKAKWNPGEPVSLIAGRMDGNPHETVIQVLPRPEGQYWDRTSPGVGVVTRAMSPESSMHVFAGKDVGDITVDHEDCPGAPIAVGEGVQLRLTRHGITGRHQVHDVRPGPLPTGDVKQLKGRLRRPEGKDFAFLEDVFVSPPVLKTVPIDVVDVSAICVYSWHEKKREFSWRAIRIDAVP